jgi:phenylpropionate dioxygenase-like ring-hydroxylating dioxygenase large terminal subunit
MLSPADNETLTSTGRGTSMGDLLRLYWMPFALGEDLVADGVPMRVRLLGEDLLAFRDSNGEVGLIDAHCAHRRAPLFFGRNEDCGLRCIYHGWKFDVHGTCVDMPNEPPESNFRTKVQLKAYPCRERNGVVWAYLQRATDPPDLPAVEWNLVPDENVHVSIRVESCNWVQALEGEIDSSHGPFLHSRIDGFTSSQRSLAYKLKDRHPKFEVLEMDHGIAIGARRDVDEQTCYWRISQFSLPFYTMAPPGGSDPTISGHAWVPIDDTHTLCVMFSYHPSQPLTEKNRSLFRDGTFKGLETGHLTSRGGAPDATGRPFPNYWTRFVPENDYLVDWEDQRTTHFSGLPGVWVQDAACQEGMGAICDRSQERLGSSDTGIIRARRLLLRLARLHAADGDVPVSAADPSVYRIRSVGTTLPRDADWVASTRDLMKATGELGYAVPTGR